MGVRGKIFLKKFSLLFKAPRLTPANGAFTSLETSFAHNAVTIGDPDLGLSSSNHF